eukprot:scaffold36624_cov62-Phaeocystis_antarctica.AAC.3
MTAEAAASSAAAASAASASDASASASASTPSDADAAAVEVADIGGGGGGRVAGGRSSGANKPLSCSSRRRLSEPPSRQACPAPLSARRVAPGSTAASRFVSPMESSTTSSSPASSSVRAAHAGSPLAASSCALTAAAATPSCSTRQRSASGGSSAARARLARSIWSGPGRPAVRGGAASPRMGAAHDGLPNMGRQQRSHERHRRARKTGGRVHEAEGGDAVRRAERDAQRQHRAGGLAYQHGISPIACAVLDQPALNEIDLRVEAGAVLRRYPQRMDRKVGAEPRPLRGTGKARAVDSRQEEKEWPRGLVTGLAAWRLEDLNERDLRAARGGKTA